MLARDLGPQAVLDTAAECFRLPGQNAGRLGIHCATGRIERLSADHLGMAPVVAAREIAPEALAEHAVEKAPKDKPVVAGVSQ